jgi:hypothetical protein
MEHQGEPRSQHSDGRGTPVGWVARFDRLADVPWGLLIFAFVALGGLLWALLGSLQPGDYLSAIGAGSGLLAVGHGIRTRSR